MDLLLCVIAIITVVASWLIWRKRKLSILKRAGIPGPEPNFWTGNMQDIAGNKNMEKYLIEKYGKIVGIYVGSKPFVIVADPELLKIIQVKEFKKFVNKDLLLKDSGIPHKSMTKSVVFSKDERWKNSRNCLNRAFTMRKLKNLKAIEGAVCIFMKKAEESNEKPLDIMDICGRLTFDVICRTSFEISTNIQNNKNNALTDSLQYVHHFSDGSILEKISLYFPEFEPIPTRLRWMKDSLRTFLNLPSGGVVAKAFQAIIDSKKKSQNLKDKIQPVSLLQFMLNASQHLDSKNNKGQTEVGNRTTGLTEECILGNAMLFTVAGYETTGKTLGYAIYLLSENVRVQDKLREEITRCLDGKDVIEYSDLGNMEYLDQVLAEILRLYPLYIPAVNRVCIEEFRYKDVVIPKNSIVAAPLWYLHRNPEYWTSPEEFIPERFSPENRAKMDHFVYQPFGAGPRMCLGMRLAQLVLKFVLVHLLKSFRLEKANDEEIQLNYDIFFVRPSKPLYLRMIPL